MEKQSAPSITVAKSETIDIKRQLNGSTFLSLEHWAYMLLVVIVPIVLLAGFSAALDLWTDKGSMMMPLAMESLFGSHFSVTMALTYAAALGTLAPLLFVLCKRTRSEFQKRPHYKERIAYKLPIYGALAILAFLKVAAFITMIAVILQSLAFIGVKGTDIGGMYLTEFLPSLLALVVFGATSWYIFKLAKGVDKSQMFTVGALGLSAALVFTLVITAIVTTHNTNSQPSQSAPGVRPTIPSQPYDGYLYGN